MSPLEKLQALKIQYDVLNWEIEKIKECSKNTDFKKSEDKEAFIANNLKLIKMRHSICLLILDFPTNL